MIIGCPKEIKDNEYRAGLTPAAVKEYIRHGHQVYVQHDLGIGIGAHDAQYVEAGAEVVPTAEEIFAKAEMIIKVKEPQPVECAMIKENQILYTYLHLAPDPQQTKGLLNSGCRAIAYETITDQAGKLHLLAPMSEVAGRLSIQAAAQCLERQTQGKGKLLGGVPGVSPCRVVIIGAGVVGLNAAKVAVGMGAEVIVLDQSIDALRQIDNLFQGRVKTVFSNSENLFDQVTMADAVIGSVLIPGAKAPKLVTRQMIQKMGAGSCVVDVAIDQGGCFETSKPTTHAEPIFIVDHVVHYCVANMPGSVPRTSTYALNNATLPYGLAIANHGLKALKSNTHLANGLNVHRGKITSQSVATALENSINADYQSCQEVLEQY